ncbi:MAG: ATP-binding protein [Defluviitaleaceae bacterium]|nr:ATP-binding protein [Defluviitaleaceae bacterium]
MAQNDYAALEKENRRLKREFRALERRHEILRLNFDTQLRVVKVAKNHAEEASLAKSDFLSRMSHEMRTPLNAVIGMAHIALRSDDFDRREYCLKQIEGASKHLLRVINDILDMSKIEANKLDIRPNTFNLSATISNVTSVLSANIEAKVQQLIINVDENLPPLIVADDLRLTQVIANLISNACKFTPQNGVITLNATKLSKGNILQIEVIDTGIGIPEEHQPRIFNIFEQGEGGTTRKYGGTGLGLAISHRIIEMMGGEIWLTSKQNYGSTFTFTIPYEVGVAVAVNKTPIAQPLVQARKILVAEDVDINREILKSVLEDTPIELVFATNGLEAVKIFQTSPEDFDMILMDISMPIMDGYEATRVIRLLECPQASTVPIIAMTANVFREDIDRCLAAGCNYHIGKPIDPEMLFRALSKFS